jgi:tetratricopeptide (TPR) repeat protein
MKNIIAIIAFLGATGLAMAQVGGVGGTTGGEGGPRQQTPTQDKSLNRVSNDQSLQNKSAEGQPQAAQPTAKHQPVAKTQEEYKAYQDAFAKPDGPSSEAAADEFAQKYPQSELRGALYQHAMSLYQNTNNSDKVIDLGHKTLAIEPDNAPALVTTATFLVNRTRDTDLDRDERLAEAKKDAQKTIELANSGEAVPAGTPPDQAGPFKDAMVSMAYSALGTIDFKDKNYPSAEQNLRKSLEPSKAQPDPIAYYTLALTLQREGKSPDALDATNKCIGLSKDSPEVASYCKNLQGYLQKIVSNPPAKPAAPATPAPAATPQTTPPSK